MKALSKIKNLFTDRPLLFFIFMGIIQYYRILQGRTIGWDTTDAIHPNFLFLIDSFKHGFYPYYNPFTLGGISTAQNFFTSFLFNPIDCLLALIGLLFSPLYVYQLQFPLFAILSGYWIFSYLKKMSGNDLLSWLGGMSFFTAMLFPVLGQAPFFFSFVLFAFLVSPFEVLLRKGGISNYLFAGVLLVAFSIKSYFFFIPFFFAAGLALIFYSKKIPLRTLLFVMGGASVAYFVLTYPVLANLKASLSDLRGNFVSPEPRLRSLIAEDTIFHRSLSKLFGDLVDSTLVRGKAWTNGLNLSLFFLFLVRLSIFWKSPSKVFRDKVLLALTVIFAMFSLGTLRVLHSALPIISSSRWGFAYIYFVQICFLLFICSTPFDFSVLSRKIRLGIGLVFFSITLAMIWGNLSVYSLVSLSASIVLILLLFLKPQLLVPFSLIITISHAYLSGRQLKLPGGNTKVEMEATEQRKTGVEIRENKREIGGLGDYKFNDRSWIHHKIPTLDGYNNTIHPIFWYLKGEGFASQFVVPLCGEEVFNIGDRYSYDQKDNQYLEMLKTDLQTLSEKNQCPEGISTIYLGPDKITFRATGKYALILLNTSDFAISGKPRREKLIAGGIRLLETVPGEDIELSYNKKLALLHQIYILISALIVLIWVVINLRNVMRRKGEKRGIA